MKPFHTIAIPHQDILEGRLTMDTFAADLWEAYHQRGPVEYRDAELFFQKTYPTEGLENLIKIIQRRISGKGGDPVIQIQTPFGGGKTHSLIALMHKVKEWKANLAVLVGTNLSAQDTLWQRMAQQLTGQNDLLADRTSPGKEKLKEILECRQPVIILMDELLEYMVKAGGHSVGDTTLAAQTLAFMQELTEVASSLEKVCVVVTLPASVIEHYDNGVEQQYQKLQKVCGRLEKIYTPVKENEIAKIIRQRLFSSVDVKQASKNIKQFVDYAARENILPTGMEPTEYRDRFVDTYPFMPEVIDVLYHRWGSFPSFQRTRGVLRILSLVVHRLLSANIPYISLADFDLASEEIRQELIKYIGPEFNSVLGQDITNADAGCKKVDVILGQSYRGLALASRAATTVFMYSFSGGSEKGATLAEIKRACAHLSHPSSVISEAIEQLKSKLYYFQIQNDKYFFSNKANINRIILNKMENIKEEKIFEKEKDLIKNQIAGDKFKVFLWEENPANIPDTDDMKLVILRQEDETVIQRIINEKGATPRVFCNTLFFLCPLAHEHMAFVNALKKNLAYESILQEPSQDNLDERQKKELKESLQKSKEDVIDALYRAYQKVIIPAKDSHDSDILGIPTIGEHLKLDQRVYERLRNNKILENISVLVLKQKYLLHKEFVCTKNLLQTFYQTPGEVRLASKTVLENAIKEGVQRGDFGLGELSENKPKCCYFKQTPEVTFSDNEVLIDSSLCLRNLEVNKISGQMSTTEDNLPPSQTPTPVDSETPDKTKGKSFENVAISFVIPKGKLSNIMQMLNYLQSKFDSIHIAISANKGAVSEQDYERTVRETLRQLQIQYEENITAHDSSI